MYSVKKLLVGITVKTVPARGIHSTPSLGAEEGISRSRSQCTLIPGDGVGPEMVSALQKVFKAVNVPLDFDLYQLSEVNPVPNIKFDDVKSSIAKCRVCIKGTLDRNEQSLKSLNMRLRNELDMFAGVVHVRSLPGIKTRHKNIDAVIIREQTEGEYSALERESVPGLVECLKIITANKSKRIAKFAFDYATKNNRKKVTAVHKANIMKLGDGLFLRSCEQIAQLYPRIKLEKMIVDNTTMQLVANPNQFDVMVTPNLYGNIVNNLAVGLVGGAGVVPGASYSAESVVFEPGAHHTFAKAAGKNIANPTAMLLCGVQLLHHINLHDHATQISKAINKVLVDGKCKTKDIGGDASTDDYVKAIIDCIE